MFDFDAGKLILIGIVALIVIGPKDLPRVLRELGRAVGKMRRMATEFQGQFMEAVREADMADIKDDVAKLAESARVDVPFNPVADIKDEIKGAVDRPSPSAALSAPPPDLAAAEASSPKAPPQGQGAALAGTRKRAESRITRRHRNRRRDAGFGRRTQGRDRRRAASQCRAHAGPRLHLARQCVIDFSGARSRPD